MSETVNTRPRASKQPSRDTHIIRVSKRTEFYPNGVYVSWCGLLWRPFDDDRGEWVTEKPTCSLCRRNIKVASYLGADLP